ncbi:hypothetical protein TWF696_005169 [Orbilia brochopaga]|uniref:Uncharacterized protein n=1 Tax=Orbilia brochopaga TaxID=3140254 RepID=A0AAV9UZW7_9PEZI
MDNRRPNSKPSRWRPTPPPKDGDHDPISNVTWRREFFASKEWREMQDASVKDLFNIPLHDIPLPPRQDASKTQPANTETRDWYNYHFPTGIVLFPYDVDTINHDSRLTPTLTSTADVQSQNSQSTSLISLPQLNFKRQPSDRKNSKPRDHQLQTSQPQTPLLNGISAANFRRIQDLRRGDRVVLPTDPSIHSLNKGMIPRGVLIINRIGMQDAYGTFNTALQVRTFIELQLYEFILPPHIRALHVVETETCTMTKQLSLAPLLPGYFTLKHAYLIDMEVDYWPSAAELKAKTAAATYRLTIASLTDDGVIAVERFVAAETVHESVNRLHVSWHVGRRARTADFVRANRWVLWLLRYRPSVQARDMEGNWLEAQTYQVLGWSTSGVLATGTQSVGAIQTSELTAGYRRVEEEMFRVLAQCAPLPKVVDNDSDGGND